MINNCNEKNIKQHQTTVNERHQSRVDNLAKDYAKIFDSSEYGNTNPAWSCSVNGFKAGYSHAMKDMQILLDSVEFTSKDDGTDRGCDSIIKAIEALDTWRKIKG